ncbi:MAG: VanZ like family [Actinomycetota bacterium]|jgi:VanZ family protein
MWGLDLWEAWGDRAALPFPLVQSRRAPWATLAVSALIVGLLLIPGPDLPQVGVGGLDLAIHAALFATWALLLRSETGLRWWASVAAGLVFGLASEAVQLLAVQRTFSLQDVVADTVGAAIGATAWQLGRRRPE